MSDIIILIKNFSYKKMKSEFYIKKKFEIINVTFLEGERDGQKISGIYRKKYISFV